jgi:hypothetical protein
MITGQRGELTIVKNDIQRIRDTLTSHVATEGLCTRSSSG